MRQAAHILVVPTPGPALVPITRPVVQWVERQGMDAGLLTLWCRHTSASLVVQENADPDVLSDLQDWIARLAPHDPARYRHGAEGPDDMPAHLRAALTQTSLAIPVASGAPMLGTWQGLYLWEHRDRPHRREVALHLMGE
jgi:secondary thiamine-phosphate synthase enzyme